MNKDYIKIELKKKKDAEYYSKVFSGISPYIYKNNLYLPIEMLDKEWLKQNNYITTKIKDENNDAKKIKDQNRNSLKEEEKITKFREPTGLVNINGICYMNAVLQCFYYCQPLTKFFINIDNNKKNNLGLVSKAYYSFIKKLTKGDLYAASEFKQAMLTVDDTFIGSEGKDSKDVAVLILSELHEELKENEKTLLFYNKEVNKNNKLDVFNEELNLEKVNCNSTIISDTFNFLLICVQKCNNCCGLSCNYKNPVYSIETDNIIIFELEKICKDLGKYYYPDISIIECLNHYVSPEIINCPDCKIKKTMEISKKFCRLPNIFIFVLSRGINAKFKCNITFQSQLDFFNYYDPIKENKREYNVYYDLIGATFAYDWNNGNGHTVAFCKTNNNYPQYYVFNDSRVRKTDINEIKGKMPYLLFYERRK